MGNTLEPFTVRCHSLNKKIQSVTIFFLLWLVLVCSSAKLSAASGIQVVRWVSRLEAASLGGKIHHLCLHRPPLPHVRPLLPHRAQKSLRPLHPQAVHQVYLPHGFLPDLSVPAAPRLPAHRHHRTGQAGQAGPGTDHCGVDDTAMGAGWVNRLSRGAGSKYVILKDEHFSELFSPLYILLISLSLLLDLGFVLLFVFFFCFLNPLPVSGFSISTTPHIFGTSLSDTFRSPLLVYGSILNKFPPTVCDKD